MKNYSICFLALYNRITHWTWSELLFGLRNNIIVIGDIKRYVDDVISKSDDEIDVMIQILIEENDEVESIIQELALKERKQDIDAIRSKWIFLIIYYYYLNNRINVHDIIDEVYCDFDYPDDISTLVSYMPKEDGDSLEEKLVKYLKKSEELWISDSSTVISL